MIFSVSIFENVSIICNPKQKQTVTSFFVSLLMILFFGSQFWSLLTVFSQLPFDTPMPGILLNYLISQYLHDTPLNQKKTFFSKFCKFLILNFFCCVFISSRRNCWAGKNVYISRNLYRCCFYITSWAWFILC